MKRIKLTVAYDGTFYSGWQIQPNAETIEGVLDRAIKNLTGEDIHVIGASRTDAGVHALGNVAVFDTNSSIPGGKFAYALNRWMPEDVAIVGSCEVEKDFHPRHCDTVKTYEYKILNTEFPIPQMRNQTWHVKQKLDIEKMREAAKYLVGEHDFKSFCCVKTQVESTVRTIYSIDISKNSSDNVVTIRVTGNGFLYNMVRIIAGTLTQVGKNMISSDLVDEMLKSLNREAAGQTAPPQGLTLVKIEYK